MKKNETVIKSSVSTYKNNLIMNIVRQVVDEKGNVVKEFNVISFGYMKALAILHEVKNIERFIRQHDGELDEYEDDET